MGKERKNRPGYHLAKNKSGKNFWKRNVEPVDNVREKNSSDVNTIKQDFSYNNDIVSDDQERITYPEPITEKPEKYVPTTDKVFALTRGFPASGKTGWAKQWVAEDPDNRINVNRDDIRSMMGFSGVGSQEQEEAVSSIASTIIEQSLKNGKEIIISDTNLRDKNAKNMIGYGIKEGYTVEVHDFDVDLDDLIDRDENRDDAVGESVLRNMWNRFPKKRWKSGADLIDEAYSKIVQQQELEEHYSTPYKNDPDNPRAILVDIDGTLADHESVRNVYDYTKVFDDKPHEDIIRSVQLEAASGTKIIIMSGREDSCKEDTLRWLEKHNVPHDGLFMRSSGDSRPDWIIKDDLVRDNIMDNYYIDYCLDDRNSVVDHHRQNGYRVRQVRPGDF